jgi:hypothetical protein
LRARDHQRYFAVDSSLRRILVRGPRLTAAARTNGKGPYYVVGPVGRDVPDLVVERTLSIYMDHDCAGSSKYIAWTGRARTKKLYLKRRVFV